MKFVLAVVASALGVLAAKLEPADGKVVFGVWFDGTADTSIYSGNDTAAKVNERLGFNVGSFQMWQSLPLEHKPEMAPLQNDDGSINMDMLNEGTDASLFLTIYPKSLAVNDSDILALANQCADIIKSGRNVYLRLAPEMNGDWFPAYSRKPAEYIAFWRKVHGVVNGIAPQVAFVWGPNYHGPSTQDLYEPYWPGTEYVDWVGISLYWKGFARDWPWAVNNLSPVTYTSDIISGVLPEAAEDNFYANFAEKYNKPFVICETAAGFIMSSYNPTTKVVSPISPGPGRAQLQLSFWKSIFNDDVLRKFPRFKMVFAFEMYKREDNMDRDFRATTDPESLKAISGLLDTMDKKGVMAWAKSSAITSATTSAADQVTTTKAVASVVTTTASKSSGFKVQIAGIVGLVLSLLL
ncbi:glycoside hydrolase superfamily [Chytriomyces cf. hyalinus JEL632]|nr:glycoside hydrolase superfamily [Chytriomyces cf. hyalinus JEL632]